MSVVGIIAGMSKKVQKVTPTLPDGPTSFVPDNFNKRFSFTLNGGVLADYEFSEDGGTTFKTFLNNPQNLTPKSYAAGQVVVRKMASGSTPHSTPLLNDTAFTEVSPNVGLAKIVQFGDSLTANSSNFLYANLDSAKFSGVTNKGFSGWRSDEVLNFVNNYNGLGKTLYDNTTTRNIATVMLGTNNLLQSTSYAALQSDIITMCTRLKQDGYLVVLVCPPEMQRDASGNTTRLQYLVYRTWLYSIWRTCADAFIDIYLDAICGGYTPAYDTYWNADHIHYTTAGYQRFVTLFVDALNTLEAWQSVIPSAPTVSFDDTANTISVTLGSYGIGDIEYSTDYGQTFTTATTNPIALNDWPYGVGRIQVRIKSINSNPHSAVVSNTGAFTGTLPATEFVPFTDPRWTYSNAFWATNTPGVLYTATASQPLAIHFTQGIKILFQSTYTGTYIIQVDGVTVATVDGSTLTAGDTLFETHPNTGTDKVLSITKNVNNAPYIGLVGATLYS